MIGLQRLADALPLDQPRTHDVGKSYVAASGNSLYTASGPNGATRNGVGSGHETASSGDAQDKAIIQSLSLPEKVFLLSGSSFTATSGLPKHGLHKVSVSDALTDVRGSSIFNGPSTAIFPNSTAMAATFNTEMLREAGVELAKEMRLKSTQCLLAPNLNLHRDPRAGRNQETFGEDPFLAGAAGAAIVEGIQSQGLQTCIKHLVCNDSETSRKAYNVQVDERPLREVYLRPFEMVVAKANPASIMTAYNKLNSLYAASNPHLLQDIVRKEWGYSGMIMSDWFGTYDGVSSLKAGTDIEMPFPAFRGQALIQAAKDGRVTEQDLDRSAERVVQFLRRSQAPAVRPDESPSDNPADRVKVLEDLANEAIILLKNDGNKLPLQPEMTSSLAIVGSLATDRTLSHLSSPTYLTNPLKGIQNYPESRWTVKHCHGPQTHVLVPLLDSRYTREINFKLRNRGPKATGCSQPVSIETYKEAKIAFMMRAVEGLGREFEIEMCAEIKVPKSGEYRLGVVSCASAQVYIDTTLVYTYEPAGSVGPETFLFHQQNMEQTFVHFFEADRIYSLICTSQSQDQIGPEPAPSGLFFGMVECSNVSERIQEAVHLANTCDEVVVCVGTTYEWEMEGIDRTTLSLPPGQPELLRAIIEARKGDVIVVNQSGAAVDLRCAQGAKAILHAHYAGQEAGKAVANVLFGRINPSGKSPYTWPVRLEDCPSFGNFPHDDNLCIHYAEGLHMGWRGFEKAATKPLFAFGHGLSYTTFDIRNASLKNVDPGKELSVIICADILNTGKTAGKQVLQVYSTGPTAQSSPKSLEAFTKTGTIDAGETASISAKLGRRAFSHWSAADKAWKVEKGEYRILLSFTSDTVEKELRYKVENSFTWTGLE